MTGIQLAKILIDIRSDIPIIICTGFSEKISEDKAKAMGVRGYVMKPVVKSELDKKLCHGYYILSGSGSFLNCKFLL